MSKTKNKNFIALCLLPPFETIFVCWWVWGTLMKKDKDLYQGLSSFAMFAIAEMVLLRLLWLVYPHNELVQFLNIWTWFLGAIPKAMWTVLNSPFHFHINIF
ncbi:hypothetical protein [Burkholderia cenocepacia]|uniref:hypothetical protein n=1 Tax=Burkholderia cenocepacia TaxID=95486 RepID=UPI0009C641B0|nr:hypothetical protein [Burkholderia cenocepacia]ONV98664.1 hypothetical protein A8E80_17450 [Burkholderia cenocepacia]